MYAFTYGALLALGLILPLGIQNIFIFNQGAAQPHFLRALPSVMTAVLCDALMIILAVLGVSVALLSLPWLKTSILAIGCCFLAYMGWTIWNTKPATNSFNNKPLSIKQQIGFSASVSLFNPHALLDTIGIIGTNSLNFMGHTKWLYTSACILVSLLWFFSLAIAGHFLRKMDNSGKGFLILNKVSAVIIWGTALYIAKFLLLEWHSLQLTYYTKD